MYRYTFLALIASLLSIVSAAETPGEKPLLVGAAIANVTPWLGDGLVGNFGTPPPAKYVHDELHARCFALDDGDTRIGLVVIDNIGISREVLDEAKRQVTEATCLPADRMLMSCTHTHSSVSTKGKNSGQPEQEFSDYQRFVAHRIADGVQATVKIVDALQKMFAELAQTP